jgi:hypothetical protein
MSYSIFEVNGSLTAVTAWHSVASSPLRTRFTFVYVPSQGVPFIVSLSMWVSLDVPVDAVCHSQGHNNNSRYLCMPICHQQHLPHILEAVSDASFVFYKSRKKMLCLKTVKCFISILFVRILHMFLMTCSISLC